MAQTNGARNRSAGHALEKLFARLLREIGFEHVVTCRSENLRRDGLGVDLMNTDEFKNGRLPYNVQCKNSCDRPQYDVLLPAMPKDKDVVNVIIHKYTVKSKEGKFMPRGHFAIMDMNDFLAMAKKIRELEADNKSKRELLTHYGKNIFNNEGPN